MSSSWRRDLRDLPDPGEEPSGWFAVVGEGEPDGDPPAMPRAYADYARAADAATRPLRGTSAGVALVVVAFLVSVVHYADNVLSYDDYPQPAPGSAIPSPPVEVVAGDWFVFTAFGLTGLALLLRRRVVPAAVCLAVYSGSGLVGVGHYTVPGALDMVWWRQLHVVVDIAVGIALLGFAWWVFQANRPVVVRPGRGPGRWRSRR